MIVDVFLPCSSFSYYKGYQGHCPILLHGKKKILSPGSAESFRRCPNLNMPYFQVVGVCWVLNMGRSAFTKVGGKNHESCLLSHEEGDRHLLGDRTAGNRKDQYVVTFLSLGHNALWGAEGEDVQGSQGQWQEYRRGRNVPLPLLIKCPTHSGEGRLKEKVL